jgi:large subunit ribosomal protein L25
MAKEVLHVEEREIKTKSYIKDLKKSGKLPGVYYRQGRKAVPIILDQHDFKQMIAHRTNLFDLDFGKGKKRQSIIRELQFHPITGEIIHVDLMGIAATEKVVIKVPLNLVGSAIGVKEEGGILEHSNR